MEVLKVMASGSGVVFSIELQLIEVKTRLERRSYFVFPVFTDQSTKMIVYICRTNLKSTIYVE
jgi:hypothetical protein